MACQQRLLRSVRFVAGAYSNKRMDETERDDTAALELLIDAASLGHSLSKCMVGRAMWYGKLPGGQDAGLDLVIKAAEEGCATAYLYLETLEQTGKL